MRGNIMVMLVVLSVCCSGCAFINVPLMQVTQPLEETVLEGQGKNKILLIDLSGVITSERRQSLTAFESGPDPVARVKEELDRAAEDARIKAVVLKINSPGGTVTASDIIYKEVLNYKEKTGVPVIACLMDTAASGGYYVANAADTIIAHPTTVTGSIGVIAMKFNVKGLMNKLGVTEEAIKSGDKKDILSPFRGITDEEKKLMQDIIDALYRQFIAVVDAGRKDLSADQLKPLADGRIFTAQQALDAKLIDAIGYLDDAINAAKARTGIEDARVIVYHRPAAYKNNIYSQATINILGLGEHSFGEYQPVRFMYLWNP